MRKWIIILILLILGILAYNYIYKDHRNIESEKAEFVLTSIELSKQFSSNPIDAEQKYLNRTIEVSGTITEFNNTNLTLDQKVFCQFMQEITTNSKTIRVKGRFIGYDDLLEQIKLDQCIIVY
jgi:hypothetical protein